MGSKPILLNLILIVLSLNLAKAQEKNFHTSLGLRMGSSISLGQFQSKNINNVNAGFASNSPYGFDFFVLQNLGKRIGISISSTSMYYKLDIESFEKSISINNRGLTSYQGLTYRVENTDSEWEVNVANFGVYYYKNIGKKKKILLRFIGSATITEMVSPSFNLEISNSSNSILLNIEGSETWREVFFLPPIDGFSVEVNAQYFFSNHFAITPKIYYVNSIGWFNSSDKALINQSKVNFQAINMMLGVSYTFFYKRGAK